MLEGGGKGVHKEGSGKDMQEEDGEGLDMGFIRDGFFKWLPRSQGTKNAKLEATLLA